MCSIDLTENVAYIPRNNHETYRRKFIKSSGKYIDHQGEETGDELTFRGEWNYSPNEKIFFSYLFLPIFTLTT